MRDTIEEEFEYAVQCPECLEGELFHDGNAVVGKEWCDTCGYCHLWDNCDAVIEARSARREAMAEDYYNRL